MYADYEDIVGQWLAANPSKRNELFLATKSDNRVVDGGYAVNPTAEYCKKAIEKSLKRLGVDYIDLCCCHRVDGVTPIEKTM